jgi:hypothetical protein
LNWSNATIVAPDVDAKLWHRPAGPCLPVVRVATA